MKSSLNKPFKLAKKFNSPVGMKAILNNDLAYQQALSRTTKAYSTPPGSHSSCTTTGKHQSLPRHASDERQLIVDDEVAGILEHLGGEIINFLMNVLDRSQNVLNSLLAVV